MYSSSVIILIFICNVITEDAKFIISFILISFNRNRLAIVIIILTSIRYIFKSFLKTIFVLLLLLQNVEYNFSTSVTLLSLESINTFLCGIGIPFIQFFFSHYDCMLWMCMVLCIMYASCPCYSSLCFSIRREVFFLLFLVLFRLSKEKVRKNHFKTYSRKKAFRICKKKCEIPNRLTSSLPFQTKKLRNRNNKPYASPEK